jgi:23S rRNA (cytidine1920-2'-O)/16S rRNA (cytidine1409-2'-O)-methyltransferase
VRALNRDVIRDEIDLVVADLSFISLAMVLPALISVSSSETDFLLMVKPQFEVGREKLGAGGVVREPELRRAAVYEVAKSAYELGLGTFGVVASPLPGPSGNVEYFLWLKGGGAMITDHDLDEAITRGPQ